MSVFDLPSLQTALDLGIPVIKVASHSITNAQLLEGVAETELPVIASMGATTWAEKDRAFAILRRSPLIILHCVSAYPCPDSQAHLDTITALRRRYRCPVGYSGHEQGVDISVAASVLGACVIERHITIDRWKPTLDAAVSLEPSEFSTMVQRIRTIESARGIVSGPVSEECESRAQYHVALCANRYIVKGEILTRSDICAKQPLGSPGANFTGLELSSLVGARVKRDLQSDEPIPRNAVELCHSSP